MKFTFAFTFTFVLFCQSIAVEPEKLSAIFFNIQKGMNHLLEETHQLEDDELASEVVDVQTKMNACFTSILNHPEALDTLYIPEFKNYSDLVNDKHTTEGKVAIRKLMVFLNRDLTLKYTVGSTAINAVPKLVEVRVRVYKIVQNRNILLNGYQVFVKPELALSDRFNIRFNPTDFAVKKIPRGSKFFWIEHNHVKIDSTVSQVGLHLATKDSVIFIVDEPKTIGHGHAIH